eukprot:CAMPEP_0119140956 /NCGR_PEP_ID=MMETSP1310-20130426/30106_1 /TAXON_ID=464262 /ORGANISM="Genus nov. species nov., Strain RCC2339" /LENGTH=101 /DNA_ID=CAMNT_0007132363 /DNA_START=62 /DNA_END=364 /DNA_ORIENTATION=+
MLVLLQRVSNAAVVVEGNTISEIGRGILVLVGIGRDDTKDDAQWLANKVNKIKLWQGANGKNWSANVGDVQGGLLIVSNFTLHGYLNGNRPDYHLSMKPAE